jgi:general secretion pathway protein F
MPQFRYVARDAQGKLLEGTLDCPDRNAAIREVEKSKGFPVRIQLATESARPGSGAQSVAAPVAAVAVQSMSYGQQHLFTEQLALLLNAGMTLDEALSILVRRMKHPKLHGLSKALHMALVEGRSLSQALRDYPKIFSPLYVNMVAAGEASGTLGTSSSDSLLTSPRSNSSAIASNRRWSIPPFSSSWAPSWSPSS